MKRSLKKMVFVEPKSTHLHIYSRVCIPRLGSVLLGTIMRAKGFDVRVFIEDIQAIDMAELHSADLVAVSAITSTAPQSYKLADMMRAAGKVVVMGGTHTSFMPEEGMQHADFIVRGEGEFAFQELVEAIQRGEGFDKIQNLTYRDDSGRVISNPERPKIKASFNDAIHTFFAIANLPQANYEDSPVEGCCSERFDRAGQMKKKQSPLPKPPPLSPR